MQQWLWLSYLYILNKCALISNNCCALCHLEDSFKLKVHRQTDRQMDGQTNKTIYRAAVAAKNLRLIQPSFLCHYSADVKQHYWQTTEVLNISITKLLTNPFSHI